jgi:hypothetical protein
MTFAGTERRRQLVTAVVAGALLLVMGAVLIMGFRLATQMRTEITALQTASALQTYPEEISHQLNTLRDRLEVRAYAGQALADLQATVSHFDQELKKLDAAGDSDSPQLGRAMLLWHQYSPVLSRTSTPIPAAARCRARGASTTPRSSGRSCSPVTTPGRCRNNWQRSPPACS